MALKDIFSMIKADRYTADGREELVKAQEAETEDRTYQIGEISQKTGLQKTANGWVEPKAGGAGNTKKDASGAEVLNNKYYKNDVRTEEGEKKILSETKTEVLENKVKDLENLKQKNGGKLGVQGEKSLQLAKAELAKRNESKTVEGSQSEGMSKHWVQKGEKAEFVERTPEEEKKMWQKVAARLSDDKLKQAIKNREGRELKPVEKIMLEAAKSELEKRNTSEPESKKEDVRKQLLELEKQRRSYKDDTVENYAGHNIRLKQASLLRQAGFNGRSDFDNYLKEKMPADSAPRVLTGDTKIRIRK